MVPFQFDALNNLQETVTTRSLFAVAMLAI